MGFTAKLMIVYLILALLAGVSFAFKKKTIGMVILALMALGIIVLGYMWFTSPM